MMSDLLARLGPGLAKALLRAALPPAEREALDGVMAGVEWGIDAVAKTAGAAWDAQSKARELEIVSGRLVREVQAAMQAEGGALPEREAAAAVAVVRHAVERMALGEVDVLLRHDLHAERLVGALEGLVVEELRALEPATARWAQRLLAESVRAVLRNASVRPAFAEASVAEVLQRLSALQAAVQAPRRPDGADARFEVEWREALAERLDRVKVYGPPWGAENTLRLALAMVPLAVAARGADGSLGPAGLAEEAFSPGERFVVAGEAGSGKTTLLAWLAVRTALHQLPPALSGWAGRTPFFVPLRQWREGRLPPLAELVGGVLPGLAESAPRGWVGRRFRKGVVLFLDGIDELAAPRRHELFSWVAQLRQEFRQPRPIVVLSGRPAALRDGRGRRAVPMEGWSERVLLPLRGAQVGRFVHRWHEARAEEVPARAAAIRALAPRLEQALREPALEGLASRPLTLGLLCAVHEQRKGALPRARADLYDYVVGMLLCGRDEAGVDPHGPALNRAARERLLAHLAWWLQDNGQHDAPAAEVDDKLHEAHPTQDPAALRHWLVERSGLLRYNGPAWVEFVHRSFQEYLAARHALAANNLGVLARCGHKDEWREVLCFALDVAEGERRDRLVSRLRAEAARSPSRRAFVESMVGRA